MLELKILDLTSRLPGPLATHLLAKLGAKVTKLEWEDRPDPFRLGDGESDPIFKIWYDNFNSNKKIKIENFEGFKKEELDSFDLILYSPQKRYQDFFSEKHKRIEILGGRESKYMHDLNALAMSKSFNLNKGELPHLPFAGILYAQNIATNALALLQNQKTHHKMYLSDISEEVLDLFWDESLGFDSKHLHTGKFPCYNIYRSADKHLVALACVEERFWAKFIELFNLNLELTDRFDTSDKVKAIIYDRLSALSLEEIKKIIGENDICISYLPH